MGNFRDDMDIEFSDDKTETNSSNLIDINKLRKLESAGGVVTHGIFENWHKLDDSVPSELIEAWKNRIKAEQRLADLVYKHLTNKK